MKVTGKQFSDGANRGISHARRGSSGLVDPDMARDLNLLKETVSRPPSLIFRSY